MNKMKESSRYYRRANKPILGCIGKLERLALGLRQLPLDALPNILRGAAESLQDAVD